MNTQYTAQKRTAATCANCVPRAKVPKAAMRRAGAAAIWASAFDKLVAQGEFGGPAALERLRAKCTAW